MDNREMVHAEALAIPNWPQRFHPFRFAAGLASACGFVFIAIHLPEMLSDDDIGIWWLGIFTAIAFAFLTYSLIEASGFFSIGLSRRITPHADIEHGPCIEIPTGRKTPFLATLIAALAAPAGAVMIYAWATHADAVLIPRDEVAEHVPFIASTAVSTLVIALLPLRIRSTTVLRLHEDGIRRRATIRRLRVRTYDTFVKWDDIEDVVPDVYTVHARGATIHYPMIRLRVPGPVPTARLVPFDEEDEIALTAYALVSEPNALFELIRRLHIRPEDRHLVARPDSVDLLRPAPLFDRFRAARGVETRW